MGTEETENVIDLFSFLTKIQTEIKQTFPSLGRSRRGSPWRLSNNKKERLSPVFSI
jgi:hypothetical protein